MRLLEDEWYMCKIPVGQAYTGERTFSEVPLQYTRDTDDAYHISHKFSLTCNVQPLFRMVKADD
ncbi:hypothetical protein VPHD148_0105 [Vibrio phage D148]